MGKVKCRTKRYHLQFKGTLIIHCLYKYCTVCVQSVYRQCTDNMDLVGHFDIFNLDTASIYSPYLNGPNAKM